MNDYLDYFKKHRIVAVVRAKSKHDAFLITDALVKGGIKIIEITFTVPNAEEVIKTLHEEFSGSDILIGAGTITNIAQAESALHAKASFLVSPGFSLDVAKFALENNIPYLSGALTPTEMMEVSKYSEIVKLFPGSAVSPDYVKALLGPFPDLKIMPTGGVDFNNITEWLNAGAVAVGIGGELTKPAATGDYQKVTAIAKAFVDKVERWNCI